jgi:hypothetical protein
VNACNINAGSPWWSDAAVILTFLGALVFVVAYALLTQGAWRANQVGANVMVFMFAITLVSALGVITIFFGTQWPHRDLVRTVCWSLIGGCIWWRVYILFKVQREDQTEGDDRTEEMQM